MDNILVQSFIPASYMDTALAKVHKFNDKFMKKGLPLIMLGKGASEMRLSCEMEHQHIAVCPRSLWVEVTVTGDKPKFDGWHLLASVDNVGGKPVFRVVPGETVDIVRLANINPSACDHCGINRQRNETHLVQHEDGRVMQMGSTCIKDYLGWDVSSVVMFYDLLRSIDDEREYNQYVIPMFNVDAIIRVACDVVSIDGVYFKSDSNKSTKNTVMNIIDPAGEFRRTNEYKAMVAKYASQPDLSDRLYKATMTAWQAVTPSDINRSEWMYNLSVLMGQEQVGYRHIGILVSIVTMGLRALDIKAAPKVESRHIGTVGDKFSAAVTIDDVKYMDNGMYASWLITMHDDNGNVIKWFASNLPMVPFGDDPATASIGKRVMLTGSVKKHDIYNGKQNTVVTRCKMMEAK